jgi:nucleoside-diphosphate-sugar epimerase
MPTNDRDTLGHGDMVLLTGAAGFVGSAIRREFFRRFPNEPLLAVSRHAVHRPDTPTHGGRIWGCDLRDPSQVAQLPFARVHGLIHAAAAAPGAGGDFFEDNVRATSNLLAALRKAPLRSVLLVSSMSVYDWRTPRPETVVLHEECTHLAPDEYGRSKLIQEWLIHAFVGPRLRPCIFRPSSIYGPGMSLRSVLPRWLVASLQGEPLRLTGPVGYRQNFVYVEDVAALVCRAFSEKVHGIFNLFSPDTMNLPALAETVCRLTGNPHPIEDAQQDTPCAQLEFDNSRLVDALSPMFTPFVEGLQATLTWLKMGDIATPDRQSVDGHI